MNSEKLAFRRFDSVDDACDWTVSTIERLKDALDSSLFQQISECLRVNVLAKASCGSAVLQETIYDGYLTTAIAEVAPATQRFETSVMSKLCAAVEDKHRSQKKTKSLLNFAFWLFGSALIASLIFLFQKLPPLFDVDVMSDRLLSMPADQFSGSWRPAGSPESCDANRFEIKRGKLEVTLTGNKRIFNATYFDLGEGRLRVEYLDGPVKISQVLRLDGDRSSFIVSSIEATDRDILNAARRVVGSRFVRCK